MNHNMERSSVFEQLVPIITQKKYIMCSESEPLVTHTYATSQAWLVVEYQVSK